jgi:hypothetical protein
MIVENKKRQLAKFSEVAFLVLSGIALGIVGVLAFLVLDKPRPKDLEEARRKYVVEYTKTEQERLGIDCGVFKPRLRDFLANQIRPVLNARQPGQGWSRYVTTDLRRQMEVQRDNYFACNKLYVAGRNGEWNGLKDLGFTVELDKEFTLLQMLIRFGEPSGRCDAACLDQRFQELHEAFEKIEACVSA